MLTIEPDTKEALNEFGLMLYVRIEPICSPGTLLSLVLTNTDRDGLWIRNYQTYSTNVGHIPSSIVMHWFKCPMGTAFHMIFFPENAFI